MRWTIFRTAKLNKTMLTKNPNEPISSKDNELIIITLPRKRNPEPNGFNDKFYEI